MLWSEFIIFTLFMRLRCKFSLNKRYFLEIFVSQGAGRLKFLRLLSALIMFIIICLQKYFYGCAISYYVFQIFPSSSKATKTESGGTFSIYISFDIAPRGKGKFFFSSKGNVYSFTHFSLLHILFKFQ